MQPAKTPHSSASDLIKNEMAHNATPSGQLRSVAPGWTFWAVESMIDEIAHATGQDPAQFRIRSDQERDGAQRHPVWSTALGGAGLDLLGRRKHDRRDRTCNRPRPRTVPHPI